MDVNKRLVMVAQYEELTDSQWEVIKDFLPIQRKRKYNLRTITNAIFWILRTGSQWRNMESKFPKWQIVYYYFRRWTLDGTIETMNSELIHLARREVGKQADASLQIIDSQSVKIVPFVSEEVGIDGHKKINGRKRHLLVDTLGLIHGVLVHSANQFDGSQGANLIERFFYRTGRLKKIIADSAYRGKFVEAIASLFNGEVQVEITSQDKKSKNFEVIPKRWIVERTITWTNFFRRLAKDYEKTVESSVSMIFLMNCQVIISRLE